MRPGVVIDRSDDAWDCIIIGGGPAGLVAATYLARFHRKVLVVDAGNSRALQIRQTNNCPGFPDGLSGKDLIARLQRQAERYHAQFINSTVTSVERSGSGFVVHCGTQTLAAPRLLVATGLTDHTPDLPDIEENIDRRTLCLCPICDGYEATGKTIGVIGSTDHALREAIFLKAYSPRVSILVRTPEEVTETFRAQAAEAGITLRDTIREIVSGEAGYEAIFSDGTVTAFDALYPALGCAVHSDLVAQLGVRCNDDGQIHVDDHQQTSIEGIYAAGDVVNALNQIAVAFGHAAIAATAIHNSLPGKG